MLCVCVCLCVSRMCIYTLWKCMLAYSETREGCWAPSYVVVCLIHLARNLKLAVYSTPRIFLSLLPRAGMTAMCNHACVCPGVGDLYAGLHRTQQSLLRTEPSSIRNILDTKVLRTVWSEACNLYLNDWSQNMCKNFLCNFRYQLLCSFSE